MAMSPTSRSTTSRDGEATRKRDTLDGVTVLYDWGKETKGTNVYDEVTADGSDVAREEQVTGSIYVRRAVEPDQHESVRVTFRTGSAPKLARGQAGHVIEFRKNSDKKSVVRYDSSAKEAAIVALYVAKRLDPPAKFWLLFTYERD